ncbi:MAG: thioredoxin [Sediminibacterium sp.]|nr:thioredoxin [Sediminibacterium sp.]
MSSFKDLINSGKPVLVDFSAEWCGPCKMMAPILEQVKHQIGDKAVVIKVDVDKNPSASGAYGIRSVPTLLIIKNGEEKWRQAGVIQAPDLLRVLNLYA